MSELKPCPFCGGPAAIGHHKKGSPGAWEYDEDWWVYCDSEDDVGCHTHVGFYETVGEAVSAWNRRAPTT